MTPETPDTADVAGRTPDAGTPRLADRLSALVGQAAARQEDPVSAERLVAAISARVEAATGGLSERLASVEAAQAANAGTLEALVRERLAAIEAVLASAGGGGSDDADVKAHVDEVGGALVLRLDEVLAGLVEQVEHTSTQVVGQVEETRIALTEQADTARAATETNRAELTAALDGVRDQLAAALDDTRGQLAGQAAESRAALTTVIEGVDATVRGRVGDLAAGVLELGGGPQLSREDVEAALVDLRADVRSLPTRFDDMASRTELERVTAATSAVGRQVDGVLASLAGMRSEFDALTSAIERRVDDAALALAETLVAVITSTPAPRREPASGLSSAAEQPLGSEPESVLESAFASDADFASESALNPEFGLESPSVAREAVSEGGAVDDSPASAGHHVPLLDDTLTRTALVEVARIDGAPIDEALVEEAQEQAAGIDEGGSGLELPRRKGLFRR